MFALVCALAGCAAPSAAPPPALLPAPLPAPLPEATQAAPQAAPTFATLDNGLTLVLVQDARWPVVAMTLWFKLGALDDPSGKGGLAHYVEHLVFLHPEEKNHARALDSVGGSSNAFTGAHATAYWWRAPAEARDTLATIARTRFAPLEVGEADAIRERAVVLQERRDRVDANPRAQWSEAIAESLCGKGGLGSPLIGRPEELAALTLADAQALHARAYAPNNAMVVVVSPMPHDQALAFVRQAFADLGQPSLPRPWRGGGARGGGSKGGDCAGLAAPQILEVARTSDAIRATSARLDFVLALEEPLGARLVAAEVLTAMLDGPSGMLADVLTAQHERPGRVWAWVRAERGALAQLSLGVDAADPSGDAPAETAKARAALGVMEAALEALAQDGPDAAVLARVKARLAGDLSRAQDAPEGYARAVGWARALGASPEAIAAWPERLRLASAQDVRALASALLSARRTRATFVGQAP